MDNVAETVVLYEAENQFEAHSAGVHALLRHAGLQPHVVRTPYSQVMGLPVPVVVTPSHRLVSGPVECITALARQEYAPDEQKEPSKAAHHTIGMHVVQSILAPVQRWCSATLASRGASSAGFSDDRQVQKGEDAPVTGWVRRWMWRREAARELAGLEQQGFKDVHGVRSRAATAYRCLACIHSELGGGPFLLGALGQGQGAGQGGPTLLDFALYGHCEAMESMGCKAWIEEAAPGLARWREELSSFLGQNTRPPPRPLAVSPATGAGTGTGAGAGTGTGRAPTRADQGSQTEEMGEPEIDQTDEQWLTPASHGSATSPPAAAGLPLDARDRLRHVGAGGAGGATTTTARHLWQAAPPSVSGRAPKTTDRGHVLIGTEEVDVAHTAGEFEREVSRVKAGTPTGAQGQEGGRGGLRSPQGITARQGRGGIAAGSAHE